MPRNLPVLLLSLMASSTLLAAPAQLQTYQVSYETLPQEHVLDATVEAVHQSTVSAQSAGRIVELNVDVDDYVAKDTVILRLRDTEPRARFEAAQASLAEAQARYNQAQKEYGRIKGIYDRKLIAKAQLDQALAERRAALARLNAAKARLQEAREQLEHTVVRAPYSGIVTERHVEVGETAQVGQALVSGLSLEKLRAVVQIPQAYVDAIRRNKQVRVLGDFTAADQTKLSSRQITIFPYADPVSHSFKARVELPAGLPGLYPGMLIKLAFTTGQRQGMVIPLSAVVRRSEVTAVYVVDPTGVHMRQIRLGHRNGQQVEVLAGLLEGEHIAIDPVAATGRRDQDAVNAPVTVHKTKEP